MNSEMFETSKRLFDASESIREALDTIDIKELPIDRSITVALENVHDWIEEQAKLIQRNALRK